MIKGLLRFDIILTFLFWIILIIILGWFVLVIGWFCLNSLYFPNKFIPPIVRITVLTLQWTIVFALFTFLVGRIGLFFNEINIKKRLSSVIPTSFGMDGENHFIQQAAPLKKNITLYIKQPKKDYQAITYLNAAMKCVKNNQYTKAASLFRTIIELPNTPILIKRIAKKQLSDILEILNHKKLSTMLREFSL